MPRNCQPESISSRVGMDWLAAPGATRPKAGGDGREDVDLLVADGFGGGNALPLLAVPHIDRVFLHTLTVVQPLHGKRAVEGDRLGEIDFEAGVMRTCGRTPESVWVGIERGSVFDAGGRMLPGQ